MQDGTDTPDDHQAFADNGDGLYEELRAMVRTLRGMDPSGGFSFVETIGAEVADEPDEATPEAPEISGYETITDDTGVLSVEVPIEWADRDTAPFTLDDGTEAATHHGVAVDRRLRAPAISTPGLVFMALPPQASLDDTLGRLGPGRGRMHR